MSSLLPSNPTKEVRAATTLLNSTCIAVPIRTTPTSDHDVFLCIPKEGEKYNIAMHGLHILQTSI
jgi:hypothetical protein